MTDARENLVWEARREASIEERYDTHQHKLWLKVANLIDEDGRRIDALEAENAEMRRHWTFLSNLFDGHVVENDEPHRVKLEDGWHTGPLADHHVRTMLAIRKLAKAALGGNDA